jgi:hypothetical protein
MTTADRMLMLQYPGLTLDQAHQAALIAAGLAPGVRQPSNAGPDHFFDVSPTDQYNMDRNAANDARNTTNDAAKIAQDQRNFDYQAGRDTHTDAYNATRDTANDAYRRDQLASQSADRQAQAQASAEAAAASRYASDNNYKVGMAGAANDAERNRVTERWNQEQAVIARMDDATKRLLGEQSNQTGQFSAETSRAVGMGQLALDNNKFIAEQARSPRDLFSLYFMQRGITPDWDTMAKGGTPASMTPLSATSVLHAYDPTTAAPVFGTQSSGSPAPAQAPLSAPAQAPAFAPPSVATFNPGQSSIAPPPPVPQQAQIPIGDDMRNFDMSGGGNSWNALPPQVPASKGWTPTNAALSDPTQNRMAAGGFTTATNIMAGDANAPDPSAGGAKPEGIFNPTNAPLAITPHPDNTPIGGGAQPMFQMPQRPVNQEARPLNQPYMYNQRLDQAAGRNWAQGDSRYQMQRMADWGHRVDPSVLRAEPWKWQGNAQGQVMQPRPLMQFPQAYHRFALGTQGDYEANGMGSDYMPSSTNQHISGEMPTRLQNLIDYGAPIPPSLAANATGDIAPTLNMGSGLQQKGGGVAASLQTLRNQTKGETELYRGFVEGNNGIPWADYVDWLQKPTEFLKGAQRSAAA